ncbi:MAG: ATP-binding protein [Candidatus Eiseniibacteriota bacterium]|nr:MAG: ATP-binding protein [Candidatus Eisenbacteria bacterium]
MILSIASGKGGTGKTTVATALALSLGENVQLLDCDVEEPNAHIFVTVKLYKHVRICVPVPDIDKQKCDFCGRCQEVCSFNAIAVLKDDVLVFKELCHGCGSCSFLCPRAAIGEIDKEIGCVEAGAFEAGTFEIHASQTRTLQTGGRDGLAFVHGRLNVGQAMSPPLIRAVKQHGDRTRTVIVDAPPGTSCPATEAVRGSDFCLLVTEPTPFGLHDLALAVGALKKLEIPFAVVINRSGLGDGKVDDYCQQRGIPILMRIPFKREIAMAYSEGISIVEAMPEYKAEFQKLIESIERILVATHPE